MFSRSGGRGRKNVHTSMGGPVGKITYAHGLWYGCMISFYLIDEARFKYNVIFTIHFFTCIISLVMIG